MLDVTNVTSRFDPTGTAGIRRSFRADAQRRLSQLRSVTYQQLVERDFMAHRDDPLREMYPQSAADPHERLAAFAQWFKHATTQALGGPWWQRHVEKAWTSGQQAGAGLVGGAALSLWVPGTYGVAAQAEIDGIGAALHQHVVRNLAEAVRRRIKPQLMYRPLLGSLRKIGTHRLNTFVNTTTVRLHNAGRLNAFLAAGINRVGVVPERLVAKVPTHDHFADQGLLETLRRALEYLLPGEEGLAGDLHSAMSGSSKLSEKQAFRVGQTMERVTKVMGAIGEARTSTRAQPSTRAQVSAPRMVPKPDRPEIPKRAVPLPWFKPDIGVEKQASLVGELGKVLTRLPPGDRKLAGDLLLASTGSRGLSERQSELVGRLISRAAPEEEGIAAEIPLIGKGGEAMSERERAALIGQAEKAKARFEKIGLWNIVTAGDDLVCERCEDAAEDTYTADEAQGLLPLHPNCLPGDALVSICDRVRAASKRLYDGNLIVIRTAAGNVLKITPQHPILTDHGWVAAQALDVGCNVVRDRSSERRALVGKNNNYVPARIEDVAHALAKFGLRIVVPSAAADFHGDGSDGEVNVIFAKGFLRDAVQSAIAKHFNEAKLCFRSVSSYVLYCCGVFYSCLDRYLASAGGIMGGGNLHGAFILSHARPFDRLLFRCGTPTDAGLVEDASDRASFDTEVFGDSGDTVARIIARENAVYDRVVAVENERFAGHVYNLETWRGYYIAQGLFVHNCRCALVPADEKSEEDDED